MKTYKHATLYINQEFKLLDITIDKDKIIEIGEDLHQGEIIDAKGLLITPAFMDPHVHFRQPGFEHKETFETGSQAAARGGYTHVFMMPNLNPTPSTPEVFEQIEKAIQKDAKIKLIQLAAITKNQKGFGELVDFDALAPFAIGFSDDGKGIFRTKDMYQAMLQAKRLNKTIIAHCEDEDLIDEGYIRKGKYSKKNNHQGILGITETVQLARDLVLALETGVHYHVCHVSTKQSVDLIRFYKSLGAHVTAEASPHHLLLTEDDLKEDGNYKMNPPLGNKEDRKALIEGLLDCTIDCIATDHAPHADDEKQGLKNAAFGIVGLETSFPLLYTYLVKKKIMMLSELLDKMSGHVARIFKLTPNQIQVGSKANLTFIDLNHTYKIDSSTFLSKSRNQPFDGLKVEGEIIRTIYQGEVVYEK